MTNATDPAAGWLVILFAFGVAVGLLLLFVLWAVFRLGPKLYPDLFQRRNSGPDRDRPTPARDRPGDTTAACPECGAVLPGDSPQGLCARCLLHRAILSPDPAPSPVSPPGAAFVAPDPADLAPRFPQLEILGLLGQGGMGAVYKARQLKLDRIVALKVLPTEWGRDPAFAERFQREARTLAKLNHPHIVAVHDFGEAGGHFYLLMEFMDGANLRQLLQAGPIEPRLALQVIPQICDALQYAHEEGVVHRDVKPENILLDARGRVKIADFGLAKLVGSSRASFTLTGTNQVMGTLDYMAPEQRSRPQEVDHRADIYALGVVFYEMLTGELPLGRFAPPSKTAGVDGRIDNVVFRALEREPDQRYQRASDVRSEVESISGAAGAPAARGDASTVAVPEDLSLRVRGLSAALIVSALVAMIQWGFILLATVGGFGPGRATEREAPTYFFGLAALVAASGIIILGAVKLRRFQAYGLVVAAIILAMLPWSAHCLIGIPAGARAWWALSRPDVRAAFAANLRRGSKTPQPSAPLQRKRRSFWRSFLSVFIGSPRRDDPSFPNQPSA